MSETTSTLLLWFFVFFCVCLCLGLALAGTPGASGEHHLHLHLHRHEHKHEHKSSAMRVHHTQIDIDKLPYRDDGRVLFGGMWVRREQLEARQHQAQLMERNEGER